MARTNDGGCFSALFDLIFDLLNKLIELIVRLVSKGSCTTRKIINAFLLVVLIWEVIICYLLWPE